MKYNILHNFISPVTGKLADINQLPDLTQNHLWVGNDKNKLVEIKITDLISAKHPLTKGNLLIGDDKNQASEVQTINFNNLPTLSTTSVPYLTGGFVGKVFEGTSSGKPRESSVVADMYADMGVLNAKFYAGNFIMSSGLSLSYPKAQFLNSLTAGAILKTSNSGSGRLEAISRLDVTNLPALASGKLWLGDSTNEPVAQTVINTSNLPALTNGKVWQGDVNNRPVEKTLDFAPLDATYILKQPYNSLPNAQSLNSLGVGMVKLIAGGAFALAIADDDYATKSTLENLKNEAQGFRNEAETFAQEANTSATEAATSATEATTAAGEATVAEVAASGSATAAGVSTAAAAVSAVSAAASASSASGSESSAKSSESKAQQYLNQLLNSGITLSGDVLGSGLLKNSIALTFKSNPVFTGTGSITIPVGTTAERPSNATIGMIRLNTDI